MTREFKITDIVQRDDKVIRSSERNEPKTPGRLVKIAAGTTASADEDTVAQDAGNSVAVDKKGQSSPEAPAEAGSPQSDENLETHSAQSGSSSNQDEARVNHEADNAEVLPTLNEINYSAKKAEEEVKTAPSAIQKN